MASIEPTQGQGLVITPDGNQTTDKPSSEVVPITENSEVSQFLDMQSPKQAISQLEVDLSSPIEGISAPQFKSFAQEKSDQTELRELNEGPQISKDQ